MNHQFFGPPNRLVLSIAASWLVAAATTATPAFAEARLLLTQQMPDIVQQHQVSAVRAMAQDQQLKLGLNLPLRNEQELDQLITDLYNPQSPQYHHYLSAQEFTERFAPSRQDYEQVVAWAKANGLTVIATPANRRLVDVSGSVAAINRAFHFSLRQYRHPTENRLFFAPDHEPSLSGLTVPLLHVTGLDDYVRPFNHLRHGNALPLRSAAAATRGAAPDGSYLPSDMRAAYYGAGPLTGAGQTVAIFSFVGYKQSDLDLYYRKTGMSASVPVKNVRVAGYTDSCGSSSSSCDDGEQILDITNAIGMAPGLDQLLFYEGSSATDVLNQIASDNIAKAISCSWGGGDFGAVDDPIYKQFQAQGQSFVSATGDDGSYTPFNWAPPSLNPHITQVGGTHLYTSGPGGIWVGETAWSDSSGGYLALANYATPSYQQWPGVINASNRGSTRYRNDPDIALEADFDNVTVANGQYSTGNGGTSYAAPRLAGLIALANQQAAAQSQAPVGYLNPSLYTFGTGSNYLELFHDVSSGSNGRFKAVPGYDLVTGWGSPIGPAFIDALLAR